MAETSTTMPSDVNAISTTTSLATNDDVTSLSPDVIEKSLSSVVNKLSGLTIGNVLYVCVCIAIASFNYSYNVMSPTWIPIHY